MANEHRSQRTERATHRRLQKAREQGQVPRSRELPGALTLAGFLVFAHLMGSSWLARLQALIVSSLSSLSAAPDPLHVLRQSVVSTGFLLFAPLGMLAGAGLAGNLLQGAPPFTLAPLTPKLSRLNPLEGLKRVVSLRQWVEVSKSVLKMTLYAAVAFAAAREVVFERPLGTPGAGGTLETLFGLADTVLVRVTVLALALALLDVLFRRWDHTRGLKMTKREIKDERKELEGDPLVRARIRQKQMALARSRMMTDVPRATVVVTNPTEYAVALRYVPGEGTAPKLLARGRGLIAEQIRRIAAEHRIPIVPDPPLARALYRSVPLGGEIPEALFRAVAEVLALVMSRGRRRGASAGGDRP